RGAGGTVSGSAVDASVGATDRGGGRGLLRGGRDSSRASGVTGPGTAIAATTGGGARSHVEGARRYGPRSECGGVGGRSGARDRGARPAYQPRAPHGGRGL